MEPPKLKSFLAFLLVFLFVYLFFARNGLMNMSNEVGPVYTPSDTEVNFLTVVSTLKGEGLYKGFSIVYPPGRFLIQALLFKTIGVSIPTTGFYFVLAPLFFPALLVFIAFKIFSKFKSFLISLLLAVFTFLIHHFFIYSAQDIHTLAALFFLTLLTDFKSERFKKILLGFLTGLVFLFRIELGIFLLLSLLVVNREKRKEYKKLYPSLWGFLVVWIPVVIYISFWGSLSNFLYDTLYLGLVIQPRMMGLPTPPPPFGYLYLAVLVFIFASSLSLYLKSAKQPNTKVFALFSVLSFATALGRADEGHFWNAAAWLPIYASYLLSELPDFKKYLKARFLALIIPLGLGFYVYGYLILKFKSAPLFIVVNLIMFWLLGKRVKKDYAFVILLAGTLTALFIFHSLSFLRLRFAGIPNTPSFQSSFRTGLFQSEGEEIAGMRFSEEYLKALRDIKSNLGTQTRLLFIFPNHVLFYDYFQYINPTRYYYHTGETTDKIQNEIIDGLGKSETENFIFFPNEPTNHRKVHEWIMENTIIQKTYTLGKAKVELRKRR